MKKIYGIYANTIFFSMQIHSKCMEKIHKMGKFQNEVVCYKKLLVAIDKKALCLYG